MSSTARQHDRRTCCTQWRAAAVGIAVADIDDFLIRFGEEANVTAFAIPALATTMLEIRETHGDAVWANEFEMIGEDR